MEEQPTPTITCGHRLAGKQVFLRVLVENKLNLSTSAAKKLNNLLGCIRQSCQKVRVGMSSSLLLSTGEEHL